MWWPFGPCTTDALVEGDVQTTVPSLVGADLEMIWSHGAVKARPVEVIEGVVQFTDDRGHRRDPVVFVLQQAVDARSHFIMRRVGHGRSPSMTNMRVRSSPQGRRTSMATALPPPRHSVTMPRFASIRRIAPIMVMRQRAPEAPSGWPRLTAPPWRLKRSLGMPRS